MVTSLLLSAGNVSKTDNRNRGILDTSSNKKEISNIIYNTIEKYRKIFLPF